MITEDKTLIKVEKSDYKKSFRIPKGIEIIGEKAFSNCDNLQFVYIPDSVKIINAKAFLGCESLKALTIPKSVERIGMFAIDFCKDLEMLTIESEKLLNCVKNMKGAYPNFSRNLLYNCLKLKFVIVPDSTTDDNAIFRNMDKRKSQTYKILREREYYEYLEKNKNRGKKGKLNKQKDNPNCEGPVKDKKTE